MDWFLVALFITMVYVIAFRDRQGPSPYRERACTGRAWKRKFPDASKERIRRFLECFVDGMAFSQKTKLKFHPNDKVLDVYRAIYGGRIPVVDAMECETFLRNLTAEFGKSSDDLLTAWYPEATLGDLFKFVSTHQSAPPI